MKKLFYKSLKNLIIKTLKIFGLNLTAVKQKNFILRIPGYELSSTNPKNFDYPCEASKEDIELINEILRPDKTDERISMLTPERLWAVISSVKYVHFNNIDGDIIECGVWRGGCSLAIAKTLENLGSSKKVYLFDTFAGMTQPKFIDKKIKTGQMANDIYKASQTEFGSSWCYGSLDDVKNLFINHGLIDRVSFIKGDVLNTLSDTNNLPVNISLLRLDTDWYESTKKELEVLYPRVSQHGVLLVDDYGSWEGSKKAVDEYFLNINSNVKPMAWVMDVGRGYIKV